MILAAQAQRLFFQCRISKPHYTTSFTCAPAHMHPTIVQLECSNRPKEHPLPRRLQPHQTAPKLQEQPPHKLPSLLPRLLVRLAQHHHPAAA